MIPELEAGRLLRYATLAASSHNTQPWRFELADDCIRVFADAGRQLLVADPDRRELFLSAGCAVENLVVAAEQLGYVATVAYEDSEGGPGQLIPVATVHLDPTPCRPSPEAAAMFRGIEKRHTPRGPFVALPVPHALVQAAVIAADVLGARLLFVGDAERKQAAADVAAEAERAQFARDDFRRELAELVGAGAFGTPRAYAWLAKAAVSHVDLGPRYAARAHENVAGAPLLGFLLAEPGRASLVRAGRAFERVALLAAAEGFAVQPVSEPIQVPSLRGKLAALVDAPAETLAMFFRLGGSRKPPAHATPRRQAREVRLA
jgi:nitroreductase